MNDSVAWRRLRRLINIFSKDEVTNGTLNPDIDSYPPRDLVDGTPREEDVNPHYEYICK